MLLKIFVPHANLQTLNVIYWLIKINICNAKKKLIISIDIYLMI